MINYFTTPPEEWPEHLQTIRKTQLAEKLISKRLTKAEKIEIYSFLTGKEPLNMKKPGRPTTDRRDRAIAFEYLFAKAKGGKQVHRIREKLVAKHKLSNEENTFYAALKRGMDLLYNDAIKNIPNYENTLNLTGLDADFQESTLSLLSITQKLKSLIEEYRSTPINRNQIKSLQ